MHEKQRIIDLLRLGRTPRRVALETEHRAPSTANMIAELTAVPLLSIDDLGMRKLPAAAAEDLLELVMRRYERASTTITSNRRLGRLA